MEENKMAEKKKALDLISRPIKAVNIGLDSFVESLKAQSVEVIHVDWQPPAGGDDKALDLLDRLESL